MPYLGNSLSVGSSAVSASASATVIPPTALLDETNAPLLDEDGGYILDES
tara:strand:- start:753 stop:902 length:150 start_codon:yes stop_codon:yes gene_type:complete